MGIRKEKEMKQLLTEIETNLKETHYCFKCEACEGNCTFVCEGDDPTVPVICPWGNDPDWKIYNWVSAQETYVK